MVLGIFFSEVGYKLLNLLSDKNKDINDIRSHLLVKDDWSEEKFTKAFNTVKKLDFNLEKRRFRFFSGKAFCKSEYAVFSSVFLICLNSININK